MKTISDNLNILIIEDNPVDLFLIEQMLEDSLLKIENSFSTDRISRACQLLQEHTISIVLLDLSLPDSLGINSLLKIKNASNKIPIIVLTGMNDSGGVVEALKQGAQDYLIKGEFTEQYLIKSIRYSIERKKAEEKALESESRFRQIFYKNPVPMWINDLDGLGILEVNDAAIRKYGYERDVFLTLKVGDIQLPNDISILQEDMAVADFEKSDTMQVGLFRHKKKNGDILTVEFTYYTVNYYGKTAMQVQVNDITEKIGLEKELVQQQKVRQMEITEAVINAQEKQSKIIGEELHDNISQILATVKLYLHEAMNEEEPRSELISRSHKNVCLVIEEIRKLSKLLISPSLNDIGLMASIKELIYNIQLVKKIKIKINRAGLADDTLNKEQQITIYRILQEQLNNIIKYADASSVNIEISKVGDMLSLIITDNGKGFDPSLRRNGIGLINIASRAELLNGKVQIITAVGKGCTLKVIFDSSMEAFETEFAQKN